MPTVSPQPTASEPPSTGGGRRPRAAGFAILISITLLSFLVLLLLSMNLLTRMGTRLSTNGLQLGQAQQNALVGLNIALGQLEKYAGPDQRTTFPAEFGDPKLNLAAQAIPWTMSGSNTTLNLAVPVNPNWSSMGIVNPVAGDRQWTGVVGNRDAGGLIFTKTPTPVFLTWLVSGNEGVAAPGSSAYGQITTPPPAAGLIFTPTMSVTPALSGSTTYRTALQFSSSSGPVPAVLLVGPNSTGTLPETLNYPTAINGTNSIAQSVPFTTQPQDRFVVAPLVTISTSASLLPGFAGSGSQAVGRYGYVVLDEGVKAKANLRDPFDGQTLSSLFTSTATYSVRARMEASQRSGLELVQGFADLASAVSGSVSYPVNTTVALTSSEFDRVLMLPQLRSLDSSNTTSATDTAIRLRFHDLTTYSFGVLADSQRGGLRRDLTAILEDQQVFNNYTGLNLLPDRDEPTFDLASKSSSTGLLASLDQSMLDPNLPNAATAYGNLGTMTIAPTRVSPKSRFVYGTSLNGVTVENHGPTWDRLRSFYQLSSQVTGSPASVNVQAADPNHMPITPVLVQFRTYFGMVSNGGNFGLTHYLVIIIGNPYSVNLVAPKGINFVIRQPGLNNGSAYVQGQVGPTNSHGAWAVALSPSSSSDNGNGDEVFGSSVFTGFPDQRQSYVLAPAGSVLPIVNSGMGSVPNSNSVDQNWQVVPDPLASTMGSVLFHASNTGSSGGSLTIPAGKLVVLAVTGSLQTVPFAALYGTPPQIQLSPLAANAISSSYYTYNTNTPVNTTMHTQVNYGDNLSLYMLDPAYTSSTFVAPPYGRVLQAIVGFNNTQGGESADDQTFTTSSPYNLFNGGAFIENLATAKGTTWNETGSNVMGVSLARGNYFRTYLDYGLTNVYRAIPAALPNGPWWNINNCGTVNGYISSFDNDGLANDAISGFPVYTNNLVGGSDEFGWGYDVDLPYAESSTVMFDLPQRLYNGAGNPEEPVMSLGYLRHANLSADDEYLSPGYQPASQIGQSFFTPQVTRTASLQLRPNLYYNSNGHATTAFYDLDYLLNAAFWDSTFFSTIPTTASSTGQPVNARLKFAAGVVPTVANLGARTPTAAVPDALNPTQSIPKEYAGARYLMLDGAFNINSTSVEAWKALLAGMRKRVAGVTDTELATKPTAFPLSLKQPFDSTGADNVGNTSSPSTFGSHGGFRRLTDQQIDALATNIVLEIRSRGPFLSLAHLINRTGLTGTVSATLSLSSVTDINDYRTMAGALQTAIERTGFNSGFPGQALVGNNFPTHSGTATDYVLGVYTKGYAPGMGTGASVQQLYADPMPTGSNTTLTFSWATLDRSAGIPGWFTQGDLLQALGPSLAARSDTFVVRSYGDVLDPVNSTNPASPVVLSRAWCEAVVQRFPDYVDPTNQPFVPPAKTDTTNQTFGRRFRVVSFRWITPNDI